MVIGTIAVIVRKSAETYAELKSSSVCCFKALYPLPLNLTLYEGGSQMKNN